MREELGLIVALVLPLLLGQALLRTFRLRPATLGFAAWAWPVGALTTALITLAWMTAGLDASNGLQAGAVAGLWLGLEAFLRGRRGREDARDEAMPGRATSWGRRIALVVLLGIALFPAADAMLSQWGQPVFQDDDASIWTFKARILQEHGRIDEGLAAKLREDITGAHHLDYPLFNPLCQVWVMGLAGTESDWAIRWPDWMFLIALVLLLFACCGDGRWAGMGWVVALVAATAPALFLPATGTKSDHWVAFGLLGVLGALDKLRREEPGAAWLLAVGALILVWSKNEGLMLALCAGAAGLVLHGRHAFRWIRTRPALLLVVVASGALVAIQIAFNRTYHLENDILSGGAGKDSRPLLRMLVENLPERAGAIGRAFWIHILDQKDIPVARGFTAVKPSNHGIYGLLLGLLVIFPRRVWRTAAGWPALTALLGLLGFFLAYTVSFEGRTPEGLHWHLYTSSSRVLMQILPCMALAASRLLGELPLFWNSGAAATNGDREPTGPPEDEEIP
ncbi:MAG TPA: hypothetical protein ENK43_08460 [Planctomycetes bacterium]|nr:hypothetical protein [Planctomycetota bacterium]